ncbi:hypothetical protein [uncultured Campylobacter sp.]|jgi:hypothetical protein|uniref:hypothetical protein n=1 Tax=uncultured Campylobacter sp. TaxID=218934 RepID=UPI0025FDB335|nr:hypothetical protein [uncultured Campylobacter sp.]
MSSPEKEKEKAALTRLAKFCERHNEAADEQTARRAKIAWITREIKKLDDGRLSRIVITINQIKE